MTIFFLNDTKIFIHYRYLARDGELPPEDPHAYPVDNVNAASLRLMGRGLTVEIPPQDFYWDRSACLRDPDEHQIEITQKAK